MPCFETAEEEARGGGPSIGGGSPLVLTMFRCMSMTAAAYVLISLIVLRESQGLLRRLSHSPRILLMRRNVLHRMAVSLAATCLYIVTRKRGVPSMGGCTSSQVGKMLRRHGRGFGASFGGPRPLCISLHVGGNGGCCQARCNAN
jgi:hypothetical protein